MSHLWADRRHRQVHWTHNIDAIGGLNYWLYEFHDSFLMAWSRGWSSPVICASQVWMTTATRDGGRLFAVCVDKDSGKILHDVHIFNVEPPMSITAANTYATSTPVIEEGRVYLKHQG